MKHPKTHAQTERDKNLKGHKAPTQSPADSTADLANLKQNGVQYMSPAEIMALQRTIGNRAVTRLMSQRPTEEEEDDVPGPRSSDLSLAYAGQRVEQRPAEEEEDVPGPRNQRGAEAESRSPSTQVKPLRENGAQHRGLPDLGPSTGQRAAPHSSATGEIGDAENLDGQALYGWDRTIRARDVRTVVNGVIPTMSSDEEMPRIVIFSGTHGNRRGHLVNDAKSRNFVNEDIATANAVMTANPDVEIEVVDVVTQYGAKSDITSVYGMTDFVRILAWCYSKRSYGLGDSIKSNWWPEPDAL